MLFVNNKSIVKQVHWVIQTLSFLLTQEYSSLSTLRVTALTIQKNLENNLIPKQVPTWRKKKTEPPCHVPCFFEHTAQISNEDASITTAHRCARKVVPVLSRHVFYVILQTVSCSSKVGVDSSPNKESRKGIGIVAIFILQMSHE